MKARERLRSQNIVTQAGIIDGALDIENGKVVAIYAAREIPNDGVASTDFCAYYLLPGLVDTHAHINEPGRTEWEGFETATRSAAAGGITTVVDMPLNSIPATTTLDALNTKTRAAEGACYVNYGFWGGVVPGNSKELTPMVNAGALGFKCFLIESGVDEFEFSDSATLDVAAPILARLNVPLLVHAELDDPSSAVALRHSSSSYLDYLFSRPKSWENKAVEYLVTLCKKTRARIHIVHLSSAEALITIAKAKKEGLPLSAETCPHYLTLCAEGIQDGQTQFKCAPPIRERSNQQALWQGLRENTIDFIVSDHSPCTPQLKLMQQGDFARAWGGIASLQFGLPLIWNEAASRGFDMPQLVQWMALRTARFAGIDRGTLEVGAVADLVVFDPTAPVTINAETIFHRHKTTPYFGKQLKGRVVQTRLAGSVVFEEGRFFEPRGIWLKHTSPRSLQ